ncbi:MAG: DEAD/DEAH box helicase [Crenarchaeota archaeon]|nr:DEAD/DEAH box helicase [Thermoproteota archaeon]
MRLVFRVCRWLERDEYEEVTALAEYLGRRGGCSLFGADVDRLRRLGYSVEEFVEFVERFGGEFDDSSRAVVDRLLELEKTVVVRAAPGEGFVLSSARLLKGYLAEYIEDGDAYYSRRLGGFVVKPYRIIDVVKKLRLAGLRVEDETGLLEPAGGLDVNPSFRLRDYQEEALRKWLEADGRGVVALPTGSGKTFIGLAAIARLRAPTLVVVYTREQLNQWREKIIKYLGVPAYRVGVYYSEEKRISDITITTYQTAYRYVDKLGGRFSLLVVDEVHHLPADKFKLIAVGVLAPYRLGLSATPYREDGRHEELFKLMGGIVYFKPLSDLQREGYIAPYRVIPVFVRLERSEERQYRELSREYRLYARGRSVEQLLRDARSGDESARQALRVLNRMRMLVAYSVSKLRAAKEIVDRELAEGSKIIVFTQYVGQASRAGKFLGAPVVTGSTDRVRRRLILEGFKAGKYRVVVMTTVGDEGLDIPDANVGIILSSTGSRRQFIQRLGRLLRPAPGKEAKLYEIIARGTLEERYVKKHYSSLLMTG